MVSSVTLALYRRQYFKDPDIWYDDDDTNPLYLESDYYFFVYPVEVTIERAVAVIVDDARCNGRDDYAEHFAEVLNDDRLELVAAINVGSEVHTGYDSDLSGGYKRTADLLVEDSIYSMLLKPAWEHLEPALQAEITRRRLLK